MLDNERLIPSLADNDQGTADCDLTKNNLIVTVTQTTAALTDESGVLRKRARLLGEEIEQAHETSYQYMVEWRIMTNRRAVMKSTHLLIELADLGFAWRDIARLMGVSVPAVQKWRRGGGARRLNQLKLAALLAGCDLIIRHCHIEEIASWFEMPLVDDAPVTPIDLWAAGNQQLVFEHANGHIDPVAILSTLDHG